MVKNDPISGWQMGEETVVRQMAVRELAAKLQANEQVCLLDVRQPCEHQAAALPGSVLIPLNQLPARMEDIPAGKDALVVVYCHHGIRSLSGAAFLERAGFTNAVSLAGGIDAWSVEVDPKVPRY
jgi:adenylyltransferase/sulfurtransferase